MNDQVKFLGLGVYLYGALYLVGVFVAGVVYGHQGAAYLAIVTSGLTYISQTLGSLAAAGFVSPAVANTATIIAALSGVIAGMALLWA